MGTDAFAYNGVLVQAADLFGSMQIRHVDVDRIKGNMLSDSGLCNELASWQAWLPTRNDEYANVGTALKWLEEVETEFELRAWLQILCRAIVHGRPDHRYSECWVDDVGEAMLRQIVDGIVLAIGIELPTYEMTVFGSVRLTGLWNVDAELGELYFSFDVDECFQRRLTPMGQRLQSQVGKKLDISTWVSISY